MSGVEFFVKQILDKLKPEDESDLIKKACVGWLIYQFTEIVKSYITEE